MENSEILSKLEEIRAVTLIGCKDALTVQDASMLTGLSVQYMYKLVQHREIPHYRSKGGKIIYFDKKDLNAWMMSSKVSTRKELESKAVKRAVLR